MEGAKWFASAVLTGGYGVGLFFLLSSYLITELLLRERASVGHLNVRSFYLRRILRIWPLYFFFLALVYLSIPQSSEFALGTKFLLPMVLLVGNWAVVANNGMGKSVAGPLWSISVEEQFYLAWPLIVSRLSIRSLRNLCIAMIVIANFLRAIMEKKGVGSIAFWCGTFTWIDTIAAGALLAIMLDGRAPRMSRRARVLLAVGGIAVWVTAVRFNHYLIYPDVAGYPIILLGSLMMLISVMGSKLAQPFLVYLGRISYGLYVFHVLSLALTDRIVPQYSALSIVFGFVLTIAMASISYRFLEQPFLKLKKRFTIVPSRPAEAIVRKEVVAQPRELMSMGGDESAVQN